MVFIIIDLNNQVWDIDEDIVIRLLEDQDNQDEINEDWQDEIEDLINKLIQDNFIIEVKS